MKPGARRLFIEAAVAVAVLGILLWIFIPRFLAVQGINTPYNFPDPEFRKCVEIFMEVEPGGKFTAKQAAEKTGEFSCSRQRRPPMLNATRMRPSRQQRGIGGVPSDPDLGRMQNARGIEFLPNITRFDCGGFVSGRNRGSSEGTGLTELDLSRNVGLEDLNCMGNSLKRLDVSGCKNLKKLNCMENCLESLDVSSCENLEELNCMGNSLETLDVSACKNLEVLTCYRNRLQALDVSKNPRLRKIGCSRNQIARLDLSANPALEEIGCSDNGPQELILGSHPALTVLYCERNQMESIDLSGCPALRQAFLQWNRFHDLPDFTKNPALDTLNLRWNRLDSGDAEAIRELKLRFSAPRFSEHNEENGEACVESGFVYSPQEKGDLVLPETGAHTEQDRQTP